MFSTENMDNIRNPLKPILILSKLVLISPIIKAYPKCRLFNHALAAFIGICYLYVASVHFFLWSSLLVNLITQINLFLWAACSIVLLTVSILRHREFEKILKQIHRIDRQLTWFNYKNTKKHMTLCMVSWVLVIVIIIVLQTSTGVIRSIGQEIPIAFYIVYTWSHIMSCGFVIIYTTFIQIVHERYEYIATRIKQLQLIKYPIVMVKQLRKIGCLHLEICSLANMINTLFCVPMFATLAMFFVHLLTHAYLLVVVQKCTAQIVIPSICFALIHSMPGIVLIGLLCYCCEKSAHYPMKSGEYLHQLRVVDEETQDAVRIISLQILTSDMKYTAAGMVDLDYKLIFEIIGALTAYLIILLQFSSEDSSMCLFLNSVPAM